MGGYQLMVSTDIFRGRYRESLETPKAIIPDKPLLYRFQLPTANHVFLPGHRIMVQIDRKSTRLNSSHGYISYAVFCLKKKHIKITVLCNNDCVIFAQFKQRSAKALSNKFSNSFSNTCRTRFSNLTQSLIRKVLTSTAL